MWCDSVGNLTARTRVAPPSVVIVGEPELAAAHLEHLRSTFAGPILLRIELSRSGAARVLDAQSRLGNVQLSVVKFDDLEADVKRLLLGDARLDARLELLSILASRFPLSAPALDILAAALVVGRKVAFVRDFASALGRSERTLEKAVSTALGVTPQRLLGWSLVLHVWFALAQLRQTPKQVAATTGISRVALANRVRRMTGYSLSDLARHQALFTVLEALGKELSLSGASGGFPP